MDFKYPNYRIDEMQLEVMQIELDPARHDINIE